MMTETTKATDLVSPDEAARRRGMAPRTLRRRIAAGTIPVFVDGKDHRRRLVRLTDVDELIQPRLVSHRNERAEPMTAA